MTEPPAPSPQVAQLQANASALTADRVVRPEPLSLAPQHIGARLVGAEGTEQAGAIEGAASAPLAAFNPASAAELSAQQQVAQLEAELARARDRLEHRGSGSRGTLMSWLDEIGAGLGWGILYFSLLPAWWRGQTLGKKLMRMRVVELSGQPINVMRSLKRYGGYVAGLATGGIGLLQLLWEPNRQGLHDQAAHTVVLDERPQATA